MGSGQAFDLVEFLRSADATTRRDFLRRAGLAGLGLPALGALLQACGGQPATPPSQPTTPAAPPAAAGPTATRAGIPTAAAAAPASASPSPVAAAPAGSRKPKRGGTFVTMGHQDVTSLSPDDGGATVLYICIANIHEPLLKVDQDYKIQPVLAESYQVAPDGKTWTFKLRRDVKWHDGEAFTSADVKYNFDYIRDPANGMIGQPLFANVTGVDTPDPYTAVVTLKEPDAPFAAVTATRNLVPKHVHEKIGEKAYKQAPVGTGPWKLKEYKPSEYTLLEANDAYWGGRPYIDFWRENIVPEVSVRAVSLRTGEGDSSTWPLTPEDTLKFMEDANFRAYRSPGLAVNNFPMNNERPFFSDKRARQAIMFAIDRDALVRDLMKGLAVKATANISPGLQFYYEPNVKQYPYDPAQAKQLLTEAGWKPGPDGILVNDAGVRFSFVCQVFPGDQLRRSEAEIVQRSLQALGIEMTLREFEPTAAQRSRRAGDYDMGLHNWTYGGGDGDPDAATTLHSGALTNFPHYKNPEMDRLLDQGKAEVDPEKRKQIYSQIQKIFAEDVPLLFIMYWDSIILFNRRIKGMPDKAANPYWLYQEFHHYWIEEE